MNRPPRDTESDRLISGALLRYSYLIAGIMEVGSGGGGEGGPGGVLRRCGGVTYSPCYCPPPHSFSCCPLSCLHPGLLVHDGILQHLLVVRCRHQPAA